MFSVPKHSSECAECANQLICTVYLMPCKWVGSRCNYVVIKCLCWVNRLVGLKLTFVLTFRRARVQQLADVTSSKQSPIVFSYICTHIAHRELLQTPVVFFSSKVYLKLKICFLSLPVLLQTHSFSKTPFESSDR